nr:hypothetical protein [Tanacetum cinerariifolium]
MDDSLVRAATTASSLEAEQDSGNINKNQSKATPNESSSQGTDSGGVPRCQEAMRDIVAKTRVTPLFPTMMVQAQKEMGEGSANPTDSHHTPTIIKPSTSQPQRKHKPIKTKRKVTE